MLETEAFFKFRKMNNSQDEGDTLEGSRSGQMETTTIGSLYFVASYICLRGEADRDAATRTRAPIHCTGGTSNHDALWMTVLY